MHDLRVVTLDKIGLVNPFLHKGPSSRRRSFVPEPLARRFVAIEMKDRQNRAVSHRIDEVDRFSSFLRGTGFGLAIAATQATIQVWIIEGAPNA